MMQKYTLKERKKNGVMIRLTGREWNKIATLEDGEWTTHSRSGEAIGVRYGSTIHVYKDGQSGEFDWLDVNNAVEEEVEYKTARPYYYMMEVLQVSLIASLLAASAYIIFK